MHIHDANISMCGPCFVDQAVFLAVYKLDCANSDMLLNMFFVQSLILICLVLVSFYCPLSD